MGGLEATEGDVGGVFAGVTGGGWAAPPPK